MSSSNAATPDPNAPPTYVADAVTDPAAAINELRSILSTLHTHTRDAFVDRDNRHNTLQALHSNLQAVVDAIPPPAVPAPLPSLGRPPKGAKLGQFLGKVQDVERFLQDLKDDIELQGSSFATDRQKVLYMITFLRDTQTAHDWVAGTRVSHPNYFNDFKTFTDAFEAHFGSPNKVDEALCKLNALKQSGSASSYAARFREISAALPQEEFFLSNMFFNGLKQEVQRWILQLPDGKNGSLDDLVTRAIDSDNRLHKWSRNTRSTSASGTSPKPPTTSTTPSTFQTTAGPAPMELGATCIMKPLNPTEKERSPQREEQLQGQGLGKSYPASLSAIGPAGTSLSVTTPTSPAPIARTRSDSCRSSCPASTFPSLILSASFSDPPHFYVPLVLSVPGSDPISTYGFLDSGASCSHISESFALAHSLPTCRLDIPQIVHTVDNRPLLSGALTDKCLATVSIGDIHFEQLALGVVSMSYPVILGFDWLRSHNPTINWESGTLTLSCCRVDAPGPLVILSVDPSLFVTPASPTPEPGHSLGPSPIFSTHIVSAETPTIKPSPVALPPSPSVAPLGPSPSHSDSATPPRSPDIWLVGAAQFSKYACRSGNFTGRISFSPIHSISSASPADPAASTPEDCKRKIRSSLPEPYWDFASVFDPVKVDTLPPRRPYNMKIDLEDGKTPPFGPIYLLTQDKRAALADYIDKNLAKGFICRSTSSAASPILFVKRKSGKLCLCVNYQGLNAITKRNRYPLPLISDLLNRVNGCKIFSKINLKNAFNLIRIAAGDEWKTAFCTNLGLFEYLVMPFGLTNAPATFQALIQDVLRDLLDITCVVYLDDILIFSCSKSEHIDHVRAVLKRLQAHGLFANAKKCEFHRTKVEYLGYLITVNGISMHPSKLESISSWPVPRSVKDIQSFLGFTNFYRRFIAHYALICKPLNNLTHKDVPLGPQGSLTLTDNALRSFNDLKEAFQSRPVLRHFNPVLPSTLLTDASDFAILGIHCQPDGSGALHPVAFFLRKLTPAKINYKIYDKEMLAIVESLRHMRPWLLGTLTPVSIVTDHRNLEYFMSTRVLNRQQARWSLFLADFNFSLSYAPGSCNPADAPSRRPDYVPKEGDRTLTGQQQLLLGPRHFAPLANASALHVCALSSFISAPIHSQLAATFSVGDPDFLSRLKQAVASDSQWLEALKSNDPDFRSANGTALHRNKLYVPAPLRVEVLRSRHDAILAGHPGRAGTFELVSRNFSWPGLCCFVRAYVTGCDLCARTKAEQHRPYGLLQPLKVPSRPWKSISMDFIVKLPTSHGCDTIWVVVDCFLKMAHFIPTVETIKAPDLARLFLQHIFQAHGLPDTIISDRGSIFVSQFWTRLHELIGVRLKHSTAYHPRTNGQTERINQILKAYLRCYTSYQQDDWVDYLPLAEFAYNNRTLSSSQQSPFYANYGFHPTFEPRINSDTTVPAAEDLSARLSLIHDELRAKLTHSQADAAQQFNRSVKPAPNFIIGDRVWLLRCNIKTTRPSDKLNYRKLGPFKIVAARGPVSFQLELPPSLSCLHPVFHVSLLEPYHSPSDIPGRVEPAPPPVFLDGDSTPWREVDKILDCRKIGRRYDYFVSWKGLTPDENSWVPLLDMSTGLNELIERFHCRTTNRRLPRPPPLLLYPTKPRGPPSNNSPLNPSTPDDNAAAPFEPVRLPTPPPERHVGYTPATQTTLRSGRVSHPCPRPDTSPPPTKRSSKRLTGARP
ncbi:Transposon Tf2-1 polyprotein [Rhizoctonia solani]|uniref:RNA-directed DNA polymerase n=1 Tax=Rhizoctonia solani TaxID=456999 RepID=A0A8H8SY70_9AGAM|nr:Transposon Tf2-1 polyprotein [Rhizoctonia solani]QRW21043.1 Transposon Tf2-1 polyprotein [Rhizoctonia solani]